MPRHKLKICWCIQGGGVMLHQLLLSTCIPSKLSRPASQNFSESSVPSAAMLLIFFFFTKPFANGGTPEGHARQELA